MYDSWGFWFQIIYFGLISNIFGNWGSKCNSTEEYGFLFLSPNGFQKQPPLFLFRQV